MEKITLTQWSQLLPYDVKVQYTLSDVINLSPVQRDEVRFEALDVCSIGFCINHCKPHLYPIDCLTKEITVKCYNNGEPFVPIEKLNEEIGVEDEFRFDTNILMINSPAGYQWNCLHIQDAYNLLLSWHINVIRIPEGSFIDKSKIGEFKP